MLQTSIAGGKVVLDCCVYNASGPRTGSIEALQRIAGSKSGAVLSKSATLVRQDGNDLPRFVNKVALGGAYCDGSLNSEGLPNYGCEYCKHHSYFSSNPSLTLNFFLSTTDISPGAVEKLASGVTGKPYIVSLSGLSLADNLEMLTKVYNMEGISAIELNLACPNIPGKPTVAYDFDQMEVVLKAVTAHPLFGKIPLGIKLAPYFDIPHIQRTTAIIVKYPGIQFVTAVNTIGNALFIDAANECEAIKPKNGLGGLAGGFIKHTALANVRMLYSALLDAGRGDIDIIGVGGVKNGTDAFELILCGAKAVQVGTCHWTEGSSCFERIASELEAVMKDKGYNNIEEFRGRLKPYARPVGGKKVVPPLQASSESIGKVAPNTASRRMLLFTCGLFIAVFFYTIAVFLLLLFAGQHVGVVDMEKIVDAPSKLNELMQSKIGFSIWRDGDGEGGGGGL